MSTLLVLFQDSCTSFSAGPHTDFLRCGKTATLNCPSFLTLVEKEGVIKYLGESSSCQLYGSRHQKRLDGDNIRKKWSQNKAGWVGNPKKDVWGNDTVFPGVNPVQVSSFKNDVQE